MRGRLIIGILFLTTTTVSANSLEVEPGEIVRPGFADTQALRSQKEYQVLSVEIDSDTLHVAIAAQGCPDVSRSYTLIFSESWVESYPVQVPALLSVGEQVGDADCGHF